MTPKARHFKIKDEDRYKKEVLKFVNEINHFLFALTFQKTLQQFKARKEHERSD